ncbi:MAG: hypothetical protein AAF744_03905 [Pseudomonadota bacterium]
MSTAQFTNAQAVAREEVRIADGGRMLVRGAQRLIGASLALAAIFIWVAPGASWESDVMLFKLVLSITALLAGLGLMQSSAAPATPEIEIDVIRREVRLLRSAPDGSAAVLERAAFAELSRAERCGQHLRLWGPSGDLMAEVTLSDRRALSSLVACLRDAGKLD